LTQRTDVKDPAEVVPFTADFTYRLLAISNTETIASITSVTATVTHGVDGNPSAILSGAAVPSADNKKVIQLLTGGLDGVDYKVRVEVHTSSSKELVIVGVVPVRSK
jgi:hypothetical protein